MKLERLLGYRGEPRTVADLHDRGYNFDPGRLRELIAAEGWHQDDRRQALSGEPPGAPVPGGSFERAAALMRDYAFAEGSAVTAIFEQDAPLQGRDLLLVGRFLGFDFRLGVRVFEVVDERRTDDDGPVQVWGWSYRTLRGHLERGEMRYEVRKRLDSGSVEFRDRGGLGSRPRRQPARAHRLWAARPPRAAEVLRPYVRGDGPQDRGRGGRSGRLNILAG